MKRIQSRKILMICYYFPPLIDVGCKRSVAFAKYLKNHCWAPYVLSVRNPDRHYCMMGMDKPPAEVPIAYVNSLFNLSWILGKAGGAVSKLFKFFGVQLKRNYFYDLFCIPDHFVGWIVGAIVRGYEIIQKESIDYIYVSCSPYSSALAGKALKMLTGRPLIIDFRDPLYVNVPDIFGMPSFRKKINLRLERTIIKAADVFIVNTNEVRKGYLLKYPEIASKIFTIHNGFDHEAAPLAKSRKFDKFTIVYAGNMYFSPVNSIRFFEALSRLKKIGKIHTGNFQFLYFGQDRQTITEVAEKLSIKDLIKAQSSIPHQDILVILSRSHLQLLRIIKPMISTKLFEGIALNLPFLATIPEGEVASIIREYSPSSHIVSEDSTELIADVILESMQEYGLGSIRGNNVQKFLDNFSRESMTRKLEQIIEQMLPWNSSKRVDMG